MKEVNSKFWSVMSSFIDNDNFSAKTFEDKDCEKVAIAGLFIHAARSDGEYTIEERAKIAELLQDKFELDCDNTEELMIQADKRESEAIDSYEFIKVINRKLDQGQRQLLLKQAWEIIMADGIVDPFEKGLIGKMSSLLSVSAKNNNAIKQQVQKLKAYQNLG